LFVSLREIGSDFNDSHSQELTLAKINKRMGERELVLFCVSLREISSDFNDSHSPELTLAKINKRTREREFETTARRAAQSSSARLRCFNSYGLLTTIEVGAVLPDGSYVNVARVKLFIVYVTLAIELFSFGVLMLHVPSAPVTHDPAAL
jgi:hypothetical protein